MANPNFVPMFSSDEIFRGQDTNRCLSDDLDAIESDIDVLQSSVGNLDNYALVNHSHSEYALATDTAALRDALDSKANAVHTHTGYASSSDVALVKSQLSDKADKSELSGKADVDHSHAEYAMASHTHDDYATVSHTHDGYAPSSHTHKSSSVTDLPETIKKYLLSDVFKVGYVWTSYTNTSPASILGGTWTELKGVFPYYNASTATGGSNTHKLSSGEMPTHKHDARIHITGSEAKGYGLAQSAGFKDRVVVAYGGYGYYTGDTGGNGSHNNMPKYQSLYAWRRSA